MSADDPLLSIAQIARLWGTGSGIVLDLVRSEALPSLDNGTLIAEGHLDVPLIRASWAEFMQRATAGAERILAPPEGALAHPALGVALAVHIAVSQHDAQALWGVSSVESRDGRDPDTLLQEWLSLTGGGLPISSGVGTEIYSLAPLPAVAARVFAEAPKVPRAVTKPTPALLLAVLPFVWEQDEWKVDFPLFAGHRGGSDLLRLVTTAPPPGVQLDPSRPAGDDQAQ